MRTYLYLYNLRRRNSYIFAVSPEPNLRRHSGEGWNPGGRGRSGEWLTVFTRWRTGGHPLGCHSRSAGMACFNHWIPAFACLPQAGRNDGECSGQEFARNSKEAVGIATNLFQFPSSFQRRLESRRGRRDVKRARISPASNKSAWQRSQNNATKPGTACQIGYNQEN